MWGKGELSSVWSRHCRGHVVQCAAAAPGPAPSAAVWSPGIVIERWWDDPHPGDYLHLSSSCRLLNTSSPPLHCTHDNLPCKLPPPNPGQGELGLSYCEPSIHTTQTINTFRMGRSKKAGETIKGSASNSPTPDSAEGATMSESPKSVSFLVKT